MAVRIEKVRGASGFFRPGDEIVSVGGEPVDDQLDLVFHSATDGPARYTVRRGRRMITRRLSPETIRRARLVFEEMRFRRCRSRCVFCFMDQMPPGMRPSLYEKDDDYRLSFLYGNFITLADASEKELERIVSLGLSPLYISVHAADRGVRERIFGRPMRRDIIRDMERLARRGIVMHAQIVLVPGLNDGRILERTVARLFRLYPACRSVALVPVGLTAHRDGLPALRRATPHEARRIIRWGEERRRAYARSTGGDPFLHLADEWYLLTGRSLPSEESYGDWPQLSNGVGMCRLFLKLLREDAERLRRRGVRRLRMTVATGALGARFLRRSALPVVREILPGAAIDILEVKNALFGSMVGVSGLLAGADIAAAARRAGVRSCLVVPPNALNHDGRFLDDERPRRLGRLLGVPVLVPRATFLEPRIAARCKGGVS